MLSLLAFIIGIAITTSFGWLLIVLTEGRHRLLSSAERLCWGAILGPTAFTLIAFIAHSLKLVPLTWYGFLVPNAVVALLALIMATRRSLFSLKEPVSKLVPSSGMSKKQKLLLWILSIFAGLQLLGGAVVLVGTPTYHDDSFNNWNMRGKAYFLLHRIELELPLGNENMQQKEGVSSYPVSLPLLKTWVASVRGVWSEPLINGVNLVFSLGLLFAFFSLARRFLALFPALLTTYVLCSLPLLKIQMFSAYADVMLAAHLLLCMTALSIGVLSKEKEDFVVSLRLFAFALGLTLFTKNEATVIYTPILILIASWVLFSAQRRNMLDAHDVIKTAIASFVLLALLAAPWITYKWLHGLTFGNAKSIGDLAITFNPTVIKAIWFHLTHEANWLFLPFITILALVFSGKKSLLLPYGIFTAFIVLAFLEQMAIFTFTPLATEAIKQTGISRGLLHIAPITCLLVAVLWSSLSKEVDAA